jgi:hypothetical protein
MPTSESARGRPAAASVHSLSTSKDVCVADVYAANKADGILRVPLVRSILWRCGEQLAKVFGDQSYNGVFATELANWSINFEKASPPESTRGFVPVDTRWVVDRTITWTNRSTDSSYCNAFNLGNKHNSSTPYKCQNNDIAAQLHQGIRFLDIRLSSLGTIKDKISAFNAYGAVLNYLIDISHDNELFVVHDKIRYNLSFRSVLDTCKQFLAANKNEFT